MSLSVTSKTNKELNKKSKLRKKKSLSLSFWVIEKRAKASEKLTVADDIFAQLYLLIDGIETGGLIFDRDGNAIKEAVAVH